MCEAVACFDTLDCRTPIDNLHQVVEAAGIRSLFLARSSKHVPGHLEEEERRNGMILVVQGVGSCSRGVGCLLLGITDSSVESGPPPEVCAGTRGRLPALCDSGDA